MTANKSLQRTLGIQSSMNSIFKVANVVGACLVLFAAYIAISMLTGAGDFSFIVSDADRREAAAYAINREKSRYHRNNVQLEGASAVPGGMQLEFKLLDFASHEVDVAEFRSIVYEGSRRDACQNPVARQKLEDERIFVEAIYYANDGKFVTSVKLDIDSCQ